MSSAAYTPSADGSSHALVLEYLDGRDLTAALALPTPAGFLMQVGLGLVRGWALGVGSAGREP